MGARTQRAGRMPPDERRAAIVAATLPLVLSHGDTVSTRRIAEASGVAEGTLFRVFPDKDALMCAVLEKAFDPTPTLRELAAVDPALPLRARLVAGTGILQRRLAGVIRILDALELTEPPVQSRQAPANTLNDAFRDAVVDLVGDDRGELRVSPAELARVLRMLILSATHPRMSDGHPLGPEQIVGIVLDGLLLPAPAAAPLTPPDADRELAPAGASPAGGTPRTIED